jgi:hypothetical protein
MMSGAFAKRLEEFNHPDFVNRLKTGTEAAYRELADGMLPWAKNFVKKKNLRELKHRTVFLCFEHLLVSCS